MSTAATQYHPSGAHPEAPNKQSVRGLRLVPEAPDPQAAHADVPVGAPTSGQSGGAAPSVTSLAELLGVELAGAVQVQKAILPIEDAARLTNMSVSKIRACIRAGTFPYFRHDGSLGVPLGRLIEFIDAHSGGWPDSPPAATTSVDARTRAAQARMAAHRSSQRSSGRGGGMPAWKVKELMR